MHTAKQAVMPSNRENALEHVQEVGQLLGLALSFLCPIFTGITCAYFRVILPFAGGGSVLITFITPQL
jgi:hypothetical protein